MRGVRGYFAACGYRAVRGRFAGKPRSWRILVSRATILPPLIVLSYHNTQLKHSKQRTSG
jgi:hypothetical protein